MYSSDFQVATLPLQPLPPPLQKVGSMTVIGLSGGSKFVKRFILKENYFDHLDGQNIAFNGELFEV